MNEIYLDNNATTQPDPAVVEALRECLVFAWANPSSIHRLGQAARQRIEVARAAVAALLNCRDRELIFTSGGTEANNLALRGVLSNVSSGNRPTPNPKPPLLITTRIEHAAIREPAIDLRLGGVKAVHLPLDSAGQVNPHDVHAALEEHAPASSMVLVSIHWANNETGVIQPIAEIAQAVHQFRRQQENTSPHVISIFFHTDATQAVGKIPVDVQAAGVDLLTLAAHKFHGPKGVGALFVRTGTRLQPQLRGGPQERDRRGGTENTPGIVGLGRAAELAREFLADTDRLTRLHALRDRFEQGILHVLPDAVVNAAAARQRLWNTSNIAFPHLEAEALLLGLSERGLCASAGAACSSGSLTPSPVLLAMGVPEAIAHGSIRFSLSRNTTEEEINRALDLIPTVVAKLRQTLPLGQENF